MARAPVATLETFRLLRVFPDPTNHPAVTSFVTAREVRVPTEVIFGWLGFVTDCAVATVPMDVAARFVRPPPSPK